MSKYLEFSIVFHISIFLKATAKELWHQDEMVTWNQQAPLMSLFPANEGLGFVSYFALAKSAHKTLDRESSQILTFHAYGKWVQFSWTFFTLVFGGTQLLWFESRIYFWSVFPTRCDYQRINKPNFCGVYIGSIFTFGDFCFFVVKVGEKSSALGLVCVFIAFRRHGFRQVCSDTRVLIDRNAYQIDTGWVS